MYRVRKQTAEQMQKLDEYVRANNSNPYYDAKDFIRDVENYIRSIQNRTLLCNIYSVSKSGMTRWMRFSYVHKDGRGISFVSLMMETLGWTQNRDLCSKVSGCGMDMVFHCNYTTVWRIHSLGLITRKAAGKLSQMNPQLV